MTLDYSEQFAEQQLAEQQLADEIFWEIDKLLTIFYTDEEDGQRFVAIEWKKYFELRKKYWEKYREKEK